MESFNSRLRDECLNLNHFRTVLEAGGHRIATTWMPGHTRVSGLVGAVHPRRAAGVGPLSPSRTQLVAVDAGVGPAVAWAATADPRTMREDPGTVHEYRLLTRPGNAKDPRAGALVGASVEVDAIDTGDLRALKSHVDPEAFATGQGLRASFRRGVVSALSSSGG